MYIKPEIEEIVRIKSKESRREYLRLDMNENPQGLPAAFVKRVLDSITPQEIAMYPEDFTLREQLANYNGVEMENICIVNGTDEGIKSIFEVFGSRGKELAGVYPTFEMYGVYAQIYGMTFHKVEYEKDLTVSCDRLVEAINENTAIVTLLNPNNPIGTVFTPQEAERVIKKAREHNALVIVDEAYYYYYDATLLALVKRYDNAVLLRTFSKLFSLAGCRIGYLIGDKNVIEAINKVRPSSNVNVFALRLADAALRDSEQINWLKAKEREGKAFLVSELEKLGYTVLRGEGNYILFQPRHKPLVIFDALKKKGILVKTFGHKQLRDYLRITTAGKETMAMFISELKNAEGEI